MTDVVIIEPANSFSVDAIGIQGPQGATGPVGPANVLTIGTVTSGTEASASITGTSPAQTLNLVLKQGEQGPQGIPGPNSIFGYDVGIVISSIPEFSVLVFNGDNWSPMLASELTDGGTY